MSNVVGSIPQLAHNEKGVGSTPGDFQRFQVLVVLINDRLPPAFLGARASGPHGVGYNCLGARASGPHWVRMAAIDWRASPPPRSVSSPIPRQRGGYGAPFHKEDKQNVIAAMTQMKNF